MKPHRWIVVIIHFYCLLTNQIVKAVYWNWFLTNPHNVETDVAEPVRQDQPFPGSFLDDNLRPLRQHPKDTRLSNDGDDQIGFGPGRLEDGIVNDNDQV